jgi:hypothetical protein
MKRSSALFGVIAASWVFGSQAAAATTVPMSMTFAEPILPGVETGCPIPPNQGLCGSGEVIPFGHATETVVFGGSGNGCDLRTINLAGGSIFSDEVFWNPTCPACVGRAAVSQLRGLSPARSSAERKCLPEPRQA